jgi:hypothetical protein
MSDCLLIHGLCFIVSFMEFLLLLFLRKNVDELRCLQTADARQRVYRAIVQAHPPHLNLVYAGTQVCHLPYYAKECVWFCLQKINHPWISSFPCMVIWKIRIQLAMCQCNVGYLLSRKLNLLSHLLNTETRAIA